MTAPPPTRSSVGRPTSLVTLVVSVIGLVAAVSSMHFADAQSGDYSFFVQAFHNLAERDGALVYRYMPNIQSGPISLLGYGLIDVFGRGWFPVVVACLGMIVVAIVARWGRDGNRALSAVASGGLLLVFWWRTLATWGHLDDALVLVAIVVALDAGRRRRPWTAVLLVGLTLAIKPWAIMFVPLTIGSDGPWRRRLVAPFASAVVGGVFWVPFVLATTRTLDGMRPTVRVASDSIVHLVTRGSGQDMPSALRLVQLATGVAVVTWTVLRRRPSCALAAGASARLLFEAASWPYYTVGLVLGALVWDVLESRRRVPLMTIAVSVLVLPPWWFDAPDIRAAMRLLACLGVLEAVRRTISVRATTPSSAEGGADAPGGSEDGLVQVDAEPGVLAQLHPAGI